jgi:hypothetical protein
MQTFNLGTVTFTRAVNDTIADNGLFAQEATVALRRYIACDWGDTCRADRTINDNAVASGQDRIVAMYVTSKGKICIITEWDRSYTTVMFANEY